MQKLSKEISLKSIYDLIINVQKDLNYFKDSTNKFQESTNKRFDILERDINQLKNDNREIKQRSTIIEKDIRNLKALPTITKELKHSIFL